MTLPAHIRAHLARLVARGEPVPQFVDGLDRSLKERRPYGFLYAVTQDLYVHLHEGAGVLPAYDALEPPLDGEAQAAAAAVREQAFAAFAEEEVPPEEADRSQRLDALLDAELRRLRLQPSAEVAVRYHVRRDLLGGRLLEPLLRDPWIEDIHGLGLGPLRVVHKVFGMCESSLRLPSEGNLTDLLLHLSEGMGRPVSTARPIVDGTLPDGSRINIVYGSDVSRGGSSFTIRKFSDTPTTLTQLIAWGTLDARIGAYLWLCMEHGMSVFVSGETASGKTTTLNAILPLVPPDAKILTAEDTPEIRPPHGNWQQLVTRDASDGARIEMGDLLKVGLRSRPDRIVVGEIRGAEGAVAFQAMQTGYPTYATFHASSVQKLIQRFTSDPIRVPAPFIPNLQVVLVQLAVHVGGRRLRRVTEVEEIEGYSRRAGVPVTRQVFRWDPVHDRHEFTGKNNSFVLENLIAQRLGVSDPRQMYGELDRRTRVLEDLVRRAEFGYQETTVQYAAARRPA